MSTTEIVLDVIAQFWSFLAVALIVWRLGQTAKLYAGARGWRADGSFFNVTLRIQPVIAGGMLGLLPWPTLRAIETIVEPARTMAMVGWFSLAGALSGQIYAAVQYGIEAARRKAGAQAVANSMRPPAHHTTHEYAGLVPDADADDVVNPSAQAWNDSAAD